MQSAAGFTPDMFRARIDQMIDVRCALAVLATRMPWAVIEQALAPSLSRVDRGAGRVVSGASAGLFDQVGAGALQPGGRLVGAGVSVAGRSRLPIRLLVSLVYLKHAYDLSDEALCERWSENPVWQYFSGREYYEHKPPCDGTQIGRFRKVIGEAGMEVILKATVDAAVANKVIAADAFERVIVDTTVQEKAIAYPVDSRLFEIARYALVKHGKACGVQFKQTFAKEGKTLRRQAGGYAHARQHKRLGTVLRRQRTIVGKLLRRIAAQLPQMGAFDASGAENTKQPGFTGALAKLAQLTVRVQQLLNQKREDTQKLYALHAPEVECFNKGKARTRYEFGVKVSLMSTHTEGLIVGAKRFAGAPYDGHTLQGQLAQAQQMIASAKTTIKEVVADLGYRGRAVEQANAGVRLIHRGRIATMDRKSRAVLKRRQAIEPMIGHLKQDHRMRRCYLKGTLGDGLHAIGCAAGYNIRWLLRAIVRLGLRGLFALAQTRRPVGDLALFAAPRVCVTLLVGAIAAAPPLSSSLRPPQLIRK